MDDFQTAKKELAHFGILFTDQNTCQFYDNDSNLKTVGGIPKDNTLSAGAFSDDFLFIMDDCANYTYSQDA